MHTSRTTRARLARRTYSRPHFAREQSAEGPVAATIENVCTSAGSLALAWRINVDVGLPPLLLTLCGPVFVVWLKRSRLLLCAAGVSDDDLYRHICGGKRHQPQRDSGSDSGVAYLFQVCAAEQFACHRRTAALACGDWCRVGEYACARIHKAVFSQRPTYPLPAYPLPATLAHLRNTYALASCRTAQKGNKTPKAVYQELTGMGA